MNNKKNTNHLIISIIILGIILFISIPASLLEIKIIYPILTWLCRLDILYLLVSLIILIVKKISKLKLNKTNKKEKKKYISIEKYDIESKQKTYKTHKKDFKTDYDRLYDEAVKYFGKYYVKNRNKYDVIDEYLNEKGSIKQN